MRTIPVSSRTLSWEIIIGPLIALALLSSLLLVSLVLCPPAWSAPAAKPEVSPARPTVASQAKPTAEPAAQTVGTDTISVSDLVEPEAEIEAEAEVEGEILLENGPGVEVRFGNTLRAFPLSRSGEEVGYEGGLAATFDRVDGLSLFLEQRFDHPTKLYPTVGLKTGYGFDSERWKYWMDFEQPLFSKESFSFGFAVYRITETFDREISGDVENSLTSLCLKTDYRDYFEREGALAFAKQKFWHYNTVSVQYSEENHRSLDVTSKGFFYRHSRDFRLNPPVDEGKWKITSLAYEFNTTGDDLIRPMEIKKRVEYERGVNNDVSDSEYTRLAADVRAYLRLSPGQRLAVRLMAGATPSGTLPFQKEFAVGGLGTLNAHAYKEFRGDHMFLANLEYGIATVKRFELILLADVGKAWYGSNATKDQRLEFDAGIGIGREEGLRLFIAKTVRETDSKAVWVLRLQKPF
ncbi:MAG: hypothetical protein V2A71_09000 [Candidatus Eisenbacteria bacterium]